MGEEKKKNFLESRVASLGLVSTWLPVSLVRSAAFL